MLQNYLNMSETLTNDVEDITFKRYDESDKRYISIWLTKNLNNFRICHNVRYTTTLDGHFHIALIVMLLSNETLLHIQLHFSSINNGVRKCH